MTGPVADGVVIRPLANDAAVIDRLADILAAVVAAGGSVHFLHPTPKEQAAAYWAKALADQEAGGRVMLGAYDGEVLAGTVTLYLDTPPNQPFRAEIWKLMVHPDFRRRGIARRLMLEAERLAVARKRTLLNLDTVIDGAGAALYAGLGWTLSGTIPNYAYTPFGELAGTAIYYKALAQ